MSEIVERVARAVRQNKFNRTRRHLDAFSEDSPPTENELDDARAAIAALREPTEAMTAAANRLNHPRDEEVWRTMIDEALRQ